ncbi:HemK family protein methyltransferase [bacterium]|nr:HemK family protein methyltransferase [bacterium]
MIKFLNCKIDISKGVFQPRIETEFWTKKAIEEIQNKTIGLSRRLKILDIFSGSGCIGIAVLKNVKNSFVDFVDFDRRAIEQIKANLELNGISDHYQIIRSNLFEKLKGRRYDFILANPPYVAQSRIFEVQESVLEEDPHLALFGGKDGMKYIRIFLEKVAGYLKKEGIFYLEFDPNQKQEIEEICHSQNLSVRFYQDQFSKWRFLRAHKAKQTCQNAQMPNVLKRNSKSEFRNNDQN